MPRHIYALAIGIFTMVSSDFAISGLMPAINEDLKVGIPALGYLVTVFSLAMALGGPALAVILQGAPPRRAILVLFAVFLLGNVIAAVAGSYAVLLVARVITGAAAGAFFGVAVTVAASTTSPAQRGQAITIVLQGMSIGLILGLPVSTWIGDHVGWRGAFVAIGVLTVAATAAAGVLLPARAPAAETSPALAQELSSLRSGRLWAAFLSSMLVMGATFAAFSYYTPILREQTGMPMSSIPLILLGYGLANVVGNAVVGRFAERRTFTVLIVGTAINSLLLAVFAVATGNAWLAVPAVLATGLVGVTMNPALVARVHQEGASGTLVNTVHTSMITLGVALGSMLGAVGIDLSDDRAPLWVGSGLAVVAIASMVPFAVQRGRGRARDPRVDSDLELSVR